MIFLFFWYTFYITFIQVSYEFYILQYLSIEILINTRTHAIYVKRTMKRTVKKKIIITGAAGEVGLNTLVLLKENSDIKKYDIIAIDKNLHNLSLLKKLFPEVKTVNADLVNSSTWEKYFKNAYLVIQLQAQISSPLKQAYDKNNEYSVKHVIFACEKYHIKRLIHVSSSQVVSVANDNYTITKKAGDIIVEDSKVPYIMLRPTLLHGLFDIKHLGYLTKIIDRSPIFPMPGSGEYLRQPLFVEDFCKIIISCIDRKMDNKTYLIAGFEKIFLIDLLKTIAKEKRRKVLFLKIPITIFRLMIIVYGWFNHKTKIVPDQLTALTAGDIFKVEKWDVKFAVKPTKFSVGTRKMLDSKYYKYGAEMKSEII